MQIVPSSASVAEYCEAMSRNEILANPDYQRSDKVWPPLAQSYLVETVLLGFPMPKLSLFQVTDLKSRKTIREIVDGQQRSRALSDFYSGRLRLSRSIDLEDARGKRYEDLDTELQSKFLSYGITYDLFVAATRDEVREVFRRMNLFTVPLNPEEQRNAAYQGEFKLFIHRISSRYDDPLNRIGVFSEKQLVRMQDTKLLSEVCHAYLHGIQTTNK